ncbi:MAG: DUF5711 family protein [Clostridia bacterium]|nr:DUF5711 family protein [Clostridia bacterium]
MEAKKFKLKFKPTRGTKIAFRIFLVCLVAFTLILIAAERLNIASVTDINDNFRAFFSGLNPGEGYPYKINSGSIEDITVLNGDLFVLTNQETMSLDSTAKEIKQTAHTYSKPRMSTRGSKAVVYNQNGNRFRVENRTDTLFTGETKEDEKIITAAMGAKGNLALATFSKDSASKLMVYGSNYKKTIFTWVCSQDSITSVDLSDNGSFVAVSVVGARNGEIYSKVYVFDFDYKEPRIEQEYEGTAILAVHFAKNDNVVAVGNNLISFIKSAKNIENIEYGSSALSNFAFSEDGFTALVLSEHGSTNNEKLICYSTTFNETFTTKFDKSVKSIYMYQGRISLLLDNKVYVYRTSGNVVREYDVDNTAISVFNLGNRTYLYKIGEIARCK